MISTTIHHWLQALATLSLWECLQWTFDLLIVSALVYYLMMLAKGTRAWQVLWGLVVFVFMLWLSQVAGLQTLNWIIRQMFFLSPVAIVILFLPELRHALEEVGRFGFWGRGFVGLANEDVSDLVGEIVRAANILSNRRAGALIVIERETGLVDIIDTGTAVNAVVSAELLCTIFYPGSPLHDGAVIIRGNRVAAAGCTLPLSDSPHIGTTIHTRHKAALGISEQSDATVVVVSEETGIVSVAFNGKLVRGLRDEALEQRLVHVLRGKDTRAKERSPLKRRLSGARLRIPRDPPGGASSPRPPEADSRAAAAKRTGGTSETKAIKTETV